MDEGQRAEVLRWFGAQPEQIPELLAYNSNNFRHDLVAYPVRLPLDPESHVAAWEEYASEACRHGVLKVLAGVLVQLHFPISEGLSQTEGYRAATLRGSPVSEIKEASGLCLLEPEGLELRIMPSVAGAIPVIIVRNPSDFRLLVQALTLRNEPGQVPDSMGACTVVGYNNWDRIARLRRRWEIANPGRDSEFEWKEEFRRLIPQKELYQDRFIILSDKPYSGVPGSEFGIDAEQWRTLSLTIRLEHECAHYLTRRLLGRMKNNVLDELIADYCGIVAATGEYRARWFLTFLGLEKFPDLRESGRLEIYRGEPPLSDAGFQVLQRLAKAACEQLELFHTRHAPKPCDQRASTQMALALTHLTLEELACPDAPQVLENAWRRTKRDLIFQ